MQISPNTYTQAHQHREGIKVRGYVKPYIKSKNTPLNNLPKYEFLNIQTPLYKLPQELKNWQKSFAPTFLDGAGFKEKAAGKPRNLKSYLSALGVILYRKTFKNPSTGEVLEHNLTYSQVEKLIMAYIAPFNPEAQTDLYHYFRAYLEIEAENAKERKFLNHIPSISNTYNQVLMRESKYKDDIPFTLRKDNQGDLHSIEVQGHMRHLKATIFGVDNYIENVVKSKRKAKRSQS